MLVMPWLATFAAVVALYWALRAVDYRSTRSAESLGGYEGTESVATAGHIDAHKFVMRGLQWTAVVAGLFLVALYATTEGAAQAWHAVWLGPAGVLLVRSALTIARNYRRSRVLRARKLAPSDGATGSRVPTPQASDAAATTPGAGSRERRT